MQVVSFLNYITYGIYFSYYLYKIYINQVLLTLNLSWSNQIDLSANSYKDIGLDNADKMLKL